MNRERDRKAQEIAEDNITKRLIEGSTGIQTCHDERFEQEGHRKRR